MEAGTNQGVNGQFGNCCVSQAVLCIRWARCIQYIDARRAKANHSHYHGIVDAMSPRTRWQMASK